MKVDWIIIILGIALLLAIILTVIYGKEYGRHGYGLTPPPADIIC